MQHPKTVCTFDETIKKSRFIGVIVPCGSETEAATALRRLHEQYPAASHIAFAYRIKSPNGLIMRFHDAGEPGGTAGKPILHHLEGKDLVNTLVAVIRFFGGIKLGAGGLVRAYGNSARQVIENAELLPYVDYATLTVQIAYKEMPSFERLLKKLDGEIIAQHFADDIQIKLKVPKQHLTALETGLRNY